MNTMNTASPKVPVYERDTASLRALIAEDLAASNELDVRIAELRSYISEGKILSAKKIDLMESSNKDMNRDLVARIERIESSGKLTATDREMLQALNARLAIGDRQVMQLAELRDVEYQARRLRDTEVSETRWPLVQEIPVSGNTVTVHPEPDQDTSQIIGSYSFEQDDLDDEPDISSWPLLYRILGVDPHLMDNEVGPQLQQAKKRMALKHDPRRFPNDTDAPARWSVISKAYGILSNPSKRQWYNTHGDVPSELKDFDLSRLSRS